MTDVTKAISWRDFRAKAAQNPCRLLLADGHDARVVEASVQAFRDHLAQPVLIGPSETIKSLWTKFGGPETPPFLDPDAFDPAMHERLSHAYFSVPKFKNDSPAQAQERLKDPLWVGCLALKCGLADGFIGGATRTTADTLRAVFAVIGLEPKTPVLFGLFFVEQRSNVPADRSLVLIADCAVIPDPSPKQLAQIAIGSAHAYEFFTQGKPRISFLSFSTHGSAQHPAVIKMQQALEIARQKAPDLLMDGEWQADAALDHTTAVIKGVGDSPMAGKANTLIVPNLDCGNIAYKMVQRLGGCRAVGPVLWGTARPANDLSRGCSTEDVYDMMALTTLQAQAMKHLRRSLSTETPMRSN